MNIMLQIAGLFVMIVIFIFYFYYRKSAVKQNRLFLYQSIAVFASITLDIFSIVLINTPSMTNSGLTIFICKAYLVSCLVVVMFGLFYVLGDLPQIERYKLIAIQAVAIGMLLVGTTIIYVLPINVVYDPVGLKDFTEGVPIVITYVVTFIFMFMTWLLAFVNRKQMYNKRFIAVCIFIGIWVFGSGIQGLFNYVLADLDIVILSVSFTETLGSLVIYMMLENPALNIDRVTGALTSRAFEEYLNTHYKKGTNLEFIIIDYDNAVASSLMGNNNFSKSITKLLKEFKADKVFKNDRDDFIVIRKNKDIALSEIIYDFKEQFYLRNNIVSEIPFKIIYFKNINLFTDTKDCLMAMNYLVNNVSTLDKVVTEVTPDIADKIHAKIEMEKKCDLAFSKRKVEVYLQPIYSNNELSFTAAEALVRLKDEEGKLIYPGDFIEDMEHDGRIVELGLMVFEDVCKFISENNMEELGLKYIECNLSAVQCMQENLASSYIEVMERYNINPKYINLEITETASSTRLTLLKNMQILKEYGISFSLDDFGTGNSNLNYMIEMPVEIVKFDKSMVNSYFENKIASFVMNSTIDMIKGLGHKIVFEGIEKEEQINKVKDMKVDYIQGYFYSRPIDKDSFVDFLRQNN